MTFNVAVMKEVIQELKNIVGYKVDKIYQPNKNTVILGLYKMRENSALLTCISSNNYRMHLTTHQIKNPTTAPNFCMLLRKHLIGYKIKNIYVQDSERIAFIEFENAENPDKPICKKIIIELMGKHSNIILTNENDIIIDSMRHTSTEEKAQRDIYPTARYMLPKASNYKINEIDFEYDNSKKYGLNFYIDDFYFEKENSEYFRTHKENVLHLVSGALKKYNKRLQNIENKLLECDGMDKYRLYGELITANLYKIPNKNVDKITVENYYENNKLIDIPLNQQYLPSYNAKKYFKKYAKLKNALEIVNRQKKETEDEINYIESVLYEADNCETIEEIMGIEEEISESNIFSSKKKKTKDKKKKNTKFNPKEYIIEDYKVYVGRNNIENDYLTTKFANKNDLWFHTKDTHGSHVILKTNPNEEIPKEVLIKVANIAAKHSKGKNSSKVPVDYCKVMFVKKPNGSKPGFVIYKNNKTIMANVEN